MMRNRSMWLLVLALAAGAGCSDDAEPPAGSPPADAIADAGADVSVAPGDTSAPDEGAPIEETTPDTGPADDVAPELRDFRVDITGAVALELDLSDEEQVAQLPEAAPAEVTVFAKDETTAAGELAVEVLEDEAPVATEIATFRNGLWRLTATVAPGHTYRVRVSDAAGNTTTSPFALVVPPLGEVVPGTWRYLRHDTEQSVLEAWTSTFDAAGTWTETLESAADERSGTWGVDGTELRLAHDAGDAAPDGAVPAEAGTRLRGALYIDATYFHPRPYRRQGEGAGLEGTWTRTWWLESTAEPAAFSEQHTDTLVIGDDGTWSETWTVVRDEGGTPTETSGSRSGTWAIELDENYSGSYGNFLHRMVTDQQGEPASAPELFELHIVRGDALLLRPRLRQN